MDITAEIDRSKRELAHWNAVSAQHPAWANPKMQIDQVRKYITYLRNQLLRTARQSLNVRDPML